MLLLTLLACGDAPTGSGAKDSVVDTATAVLPDAEEKWSVQVQVTLDGAPAADTLVMQGGGTMRWVTDAEGRAAVTVDPGVVGDLYVVAAHPDARAGGVEVTGPGAAEITLTRFSTNDNPAYVFGDPGPESLLDTTSAQCSHCHLTLHEEWFASPHRAAASNPTVHDVYAGTAVAFADPASCEAAGGTWGSAIEPGTGATVDGCHLAESVQTGTLGNGACADCHAPGIDGALGGRDLLEAQGIAYDAGVHCDVCHHVESVDMSAEPGVAGRLHILRPSEPSLSPLFGDWSPLLFGPYADVLNPLMGSVLREGFHDAELCGGCHEQEQAVLLDGASLDLERWPEGRLPIHSTYSEWEAGPMNPAAPCQTCHMPPKPDVGNSSDIYNELTDVMVGVSAGWERAPGEVKAHSWLGPRQRESGMLELAASLQISSVLDGETLTASVTVKNVGPGHALPTGEPMRSMIVRVSAECDGEALEATGGDVIPDFGGWLDRKLAGEDWSVWPGAAVGEVVRVVELSEEWRDYVGYGPFGDGRFDAEAKGMPVERWAGAATIVAVSGDDVSFDQALPAGSVAYRGDAATALPEDGDAATAVAGAPGFGFARVLVGADGARMVPHFLATDVASDNRLLPQGAWTSSHQFQAPCAAPVVRAVLVHRAYPPNLALERGWTLTESVMAEAEE